MIRTYLQVQLWLGNQQGAPNRLCSNWSRMVRTWSLTSSSSHIVLSFPPLHPSPFPIYLRTSHKKQMCFPNWLHRMPHASCGQDSSFPVPAPSTQGTAEAFPFAHRKAFCSLACLWVCQKQLLMPGSFDIANSE